MSSATGTEEFHKTSTVRVEEENGQNGEGERPNQEECQMKREHLRSEVHWQVPVESE